MIDPRAMKTYLMVCRENSISGAARKLFISQPAVSVVISQLEESLDVKLFHRNRNGIELTPAGKILKRRSEKLEALLSATEEEIEFNQNGINGPLYLGGTPGALMSLLPKAVDEMERQCGKFSIHIIERSDAMLVDLLRKGEIELAVSTTEVGDLPDDIIEISLASDPFDIVVGKANDDLPAELSLSELSDACWVLPKAVGAFHRQLDALFIANETPIPHNVISCDSLLTTKEIVLTGRYCTILPRNIVASELNTGVLRSIKIKDTNFNRHVGVKMLAKQSLSPLASQLIDFIKQQYTDL